MTIAKFDAIVVGSGAGGACVAWQLAKAGKKTLILEKGPSREISDFMEAVCSVPPSHRGVEEKNSSLSKLNI